MWTPTATARTSVTSTSTSEASTASSAQPVDTPDSRELSAEPQEQQPIDAELSPSLNGLPVDFNLRARDGYTTAVRRAECSERSRKKLLPRLRDVLFARAALEQRVGKEYNEWADTASLYLLEDAGLHSSALLLLLLYLSDFEYDTVLQFIGVIYS